MMGMVMRSMLVRLGMLFALGFLTVGADCLATSPVGELTRLGYSDACNPIDPSIPLEAMVTRNAADDYQLDAMVYRLVNGVSAAEGCRDLDGEFIDGQCYEIVMQSRRLSAAEITQVYAVYSSLEVVSRLNPDWPGMDCELKSFCSAMTQVNEVQYLSSTNECRPLSEPALSEDSFEDVQELMVDLSLAN